MFYDISSIYVLVLVYVMFLSCLLPRFNKKPIKGVKFLQGQGLIGDSHSDVAKFLLTDARLDKVC